MLRLVFDSETNALKPQEVSNIWCICVADLDKDREWSFGPTEIDDALILLDSADQIVGHNILCYDLPVLKYKKNWKPKAKPIDTLVISRLLNPDRNGVFTEEGKYIKEANSLAAWGVRLGRYKVEHEDWSQFSADMLRRCLEDTRINKLLYWRLYADANP